MVRVDATVRARHGLWLEQGLGLRLGLALGLGLRFVLALGLGLGLLVEVEKSATLHCAVAGVVGEHWQVDVVVIVPASMGV